jgi:hypothetical protein
MSDAVQPVGLLTGKGKAKLKSATFVFVNDGTTPLTANALRTTTENNDDSEDIVQDVEGESFIEQQVVQTADSGNVESIGTIVSEDIQDFKAESSDDETRPLGERIEILEARYSNAAKGGKATKPLRQRLYLKVLRLRQEMQASEATVTSLEVVEDVKFSVQNSREPCKEADASEKEPVKTRAADISSPSRTATARTRARKHKTSKLKNGSFEGEEDEEGDDWTCLDSW